MFPKVALHEVAEKLPTVTSHEDAETLLEYANLLVQEFTREHSGSYTEEIRINAVTAQIKYWISNGINPETVELEQPKQVASASLNGGSVSYAGASEARDARAQSATRLCYTAKEILRQALFQRFNPVITIG